MTTAGHVPPKRTGKWRPVILLEQFGCLVVIGEAESNPKLGRRVKLRCRVCKSDDVQPLEKLRRARARGGRPACPACKQSTVKEG